MMMMSQGVFVIYIVLVTLLLINMLIAMMTGTFNRVTEAKWEWQRQWASIILVRNLLYSDLDLYDFF